MIKIILLIISLISTIMVHILANTLPINHHTTREIANRLPTFFTPANYVFSIWFAIYFLLACWIWYIWKEYRNDKLISMRQVLLFVGSSILNIVWIILWHYELFLLSFLDMFALVGILFLLYKIYSVEEQHWLKRLPISIYIGWMFIATFINIDYLLTYNEFSGWGITKSLWVVIYLTVATAIALHFRFHYSDPAIVLVFIWSFIGIAVHHLLNEMLITAASIFLSSVLVAGIFFIKKRKEVSDGL
ncbi:TspO/MBR family protein [Psychrobacillus vulpis]|uniref:Tryptophan-rich sensory protein n=1 Tax=Psychrobacillus vulpis TaxID=2325572 RepID=A0A544TPJ2_9BACI|nr:tryptophan-rich sensory protein [Psychrobacillus vulpis]TQR19339.1 tryptophan-rich sensory protein [Psychrobacillus vulpis]